MEWGYIMKSALLLSVAGLAFFGVAHAQDAAPVDGASEATEVVVYGRGQSRQTQSIKASELTQTAPGTSPLKALGKLPSVSFQSSDPFGAYEWSTRVTVRGFNQNQLGFTLDGITLGDMSYGNYNGLHISRAIINENIANSELAQGAGSLDTATSYNLGGTLKFTSRDPSRILGGQINASVGSEESHRLYGRFETGTLDSLGGLRAYISAVDQKSNKWKGFGERTAFQVDAKAVLPLGDKSSLTAFVNHSERREQDDQDLSHDLINRLGYDWDNFQPNWALANQVAQIFQGEALGGVPAVFPGQIRTVDDAYYYGAGVRDDTIGSIKYETQVNDTLSLSAQVYGHTNEGQGLWTTPYNPSPNAYTPGATTDNAFVSVRTTEYDIDRKGFIGNVNLDLGTHHISAGLWLEDNDFTQARRFYGEDLAAPKRDSLGFQSNPFFTQWAYDFNTKTTQYFVQDIWSVNEALKINYGFKSLSVENKVDSTHDVNGSYAVGGITIATARDALHANLKSEDTFLPQIGAVYKFNRSTEIFGTYTENLGAFVSAATGGPFSSGSQANVDFVKNNLEPETSKTLEGGLRFKGNRYSGVVAVYAVKFENRILATSQGAGIIGNAPVLSNVGDVNASGFEIAGTYRFTPQWKAYASYSFNKAQYGDDVVALDGSVRARTKDKTVVNTPENLFKTDITYDNGTLFATLGVNYVGERYYTYENIGGLVDAYTLTDLNLGYRVSDSIELQLNVTNLTDERYVSTVGSNGFTNSDVSNTSQTLLAGAPRQVFFTVRKTF
jgi:iron complex outermembrane receptor protein